MSPDSQPLDGGYEMEVDDLAADILSTPGIEGITISGGEPFLQSAELAALLTAVKLQKDPGVILYTGMLYDEIKDNILTKHCDIIIDGEYQEQLNDGLSLRGSSNQNAILLTQRYAEKFNLYGSNGRKTEIHFKKDGITMVGIPDKKSLTILDEKIFTIKP